MEKISHIAPTSHHPESADEEYIYRPWINKDGRRIYAKDFGKKAFKIRRRY